MPTRKHPKHGLKLPDVEQTLIVFLTVCTKDRRPWLASEEVHQLLRETWQSSTAWLIGRYVVMPDHIHLFATPG
jgi:REP element-mobilizing transposase RayT